MMELSDEEIIEIFHRLDPQDLPLGVYLVRPDGCFLIASRAVRRLLKLPENGPLKKASIADYYADPNLRRQLIEKANAEASLGWHLESATIHFRAQNGDVYAEDFCKPLYHPETQEIIGYYGCLIDRTVEQAVKKRENILRERVEELTIDIGRVLHANTTTLLMVSHTLRPVLDLLAFEQGLTAEDIASISEQETRHLDNNSQKLLKALQRLFEATSPEQRKQALHPLRWEYLEQTIGDLKEYRTIAGVPESHPSFLRKLAKEVAGITNEIKSGYLSREVVRDVQRAALDLQRAATLVTVHRTHLAVLQMDHTIRALREFVTADVRSEEPNKRLPVSEMLDQVVARLSEFSQNQGVEILKKDNCPRAEIFGSERELSRAFANILHNAIKYSWSRSRTRPPWVTVETRCVGDQIQVSFENWGVPIAREEIENGSIFQLGYRGRLSKDRNRLGTGIGMTDALRVAKQHGGSIQVQSRPATSFPISEDDPGFYDHPFVTTVTITLPLSSNA